MTNLLDYKQRLIVLKKDYTDLLNQLKLTDDREKWDYFYSKLQEINIYLQKIEIILRRKERIDTLEYLEKCFSLKI